MGWYFRKSIGFGPIRVNLSKGGVSTSVGVNGARVNVGPRGTYVSAGAGGFYYRQKIGVGSTPRSAQPTPVAPLDRARVDVGTREFLDAHTDELTREIDRRFQMTALAPWGVVTTIVASVACFVGFGRIDPVYSLSALIPLIGGILGVLFLLKRDGQRWVTLNYDATADATQAWNVVLSELGRMSGCGSIWEIAGGEKCLDWKRNAGASATVNRNGASAGVGAPPRVKCNVEIWTLQTPQQKLFLLPDRVLLYWQGRVHGFRYHELEIDTGCGRFIEEDPLPHDAQVVDHTWRFVNKNGSPDLRFNDNRELPICMYGQLRIRSTRGLEIVVQTSDPRAPLAFSEAIRIADGLNVMESGHQELQSPRQPTASSRQLPAQV